MSTFLTAYVKTALMNPKLMSRAILCRIDCFYNIFAAKNGFLNLVNETGTMDYTQGWADIYPPRVPNALSRILGEWGETSALPGLEWITWRAGFSTLLVFCGCVLAVLKRRKRVLLIAVPWLGQFLSLLLSTAWADFRYYWTLNLCAVIFLVAIVVSDNSRDLNRVREIKRTMEFGSSR